MPASDQAVKVSYQDLKNKTIDLGSLRAALGNSPGALGILIVKDLPHEYANLRHQALIKAFEFANLPDAIRERYADPSSRFQFGWSLGKEIMNGRADLQKGSYFANPYSDDPHNIWPSRSDCEGFRDAFMSLSVFMRDVGLLLAQALDPLLASEIDSNNNLPRRTQISTLLRESKACKARLLHYFPSANARCHTSVSNGSLPDDLCGWHKDHSLLTSLVPAIFHLGSTATDQDPDPAGGLYIRPRQDDAYPVRVVIPPDCLAFQTGEALELLSGNRLAATPHSVTSSKGDGISRQTLALFLQPNPEDVVDFASGETFAAFTRRVLDRHYD